MWISLIVIRQAGQSLVGIMSNKLEWHIAWRDISDEDKSIHAKDKAPDAGVVKLAFQGSILGQHNFAESFEFSYP